MKDDKGLIGMRGDPMDYKEIAKVLGISTNKVKRIESQALRKLAFNFPNFKIELVEK